MKRLFAVLLGSLLYSGFCHAYGDKVCYPTSGAPAVQDFSITKTLTKAENAPGSPSDINDNLISFQSTTGGGGIPFQCDCTNPNATMVHWWSSVAMYPYTNAGTKRYSWQQLSPYLSASVRIHINGNNTGTGGGGDNVVPFIGAPNNSNETCVVAGAGGTASSGSTGDVSIKITKAIVGEARFDGPVAKIWHYRKANYLNQADPVESIVYLHLLLTAPDGCTLLPGGTMTVPLGQTKQGQFTGQVYPQPPKSYTPRRVDLQFDCDFASSASLDVVLSGSADDKGQGFATSNPDVSVIVTDGGGAILPPNKTVGSVKTGGALVNGSAKTSVLSLRAYPTNSGSKPSPAAEDFDATVNILLTYQ
ncbi:fimbrial protein [Rahnella laticis]|uniref:fimbrial protein n=1 Tax=Rahnella laticis TaxID=2787622 RepID=UPI0018A2C0F3|nr:fimbrial protein [Rahnella laticis]MBF7993696.1 hypothetical protein [Rahnella laticis]